MIDEGYIKFKANWIKSAPFGQEKIKELNEYRSKLYTLNLIGAYENGIGFGNISQRIEQSDQFIISGSKTGTYAPLNGKHYAKVTTVDISQNTLDCIGATIASSESMSHAVIYQTCPEINGVIHIHHLDLWQKLLFQVPTTASGATYGTPEMANSIIDLMKSTDLKAQKIFVMQEHKEGIFTFGNDLKFSIGQ